MSKVSELLNEQQNSEKSNKCALNKKFSLRLDKLLNKQKPIANDSKPDMVSHPPHYQVEDMTYEPIKVINAWGLNFNIGSAVKYLSRYRKKFNAIEDLKKAIFYIQDEINRLEAEHKDNK